MSESTPVHVLAYADGRPGQPIDSLFTLQRSPGGLVLTKPLPPAYLTATAAIFVAICLYGSAILGAAEALSDLHRRPGDWAGIAIGLLGLAGLGTIVLAHVRNTRARTLTLTVDHRGLTVLNGPITLTGRPWRVSRPRRYRASLGQPDLLRGRMTATLYVGCRFGLDRVIISNVPKAECLWLVDVLNTTLSRPLDVQSCP